MKNLAPVIICFLVCLISSSWIRPGGEELPGTYITKTGHIELISEAPLEIIKANSHKLYGVIDLINKKFAFSVTINSFEGFKSSLQKEHFREKFLESDRFPKAIFQGKLITSEVFNKPGQYAIRAKGILDVHGVKKERIISGNIALSTEGVKLDASLKVPLSDHDITVPTIVNQKIAREINIIVKAEMEKKR